MISAQMRSAVLVIPMLLFDSLADIVLLDGPTTSTEHPAGCNSGVMKGPIKVNGMSHTYLAGDGGHVVGDRLTVKHNAGFSVFSACEREWTPESIAQLKLLGRRISFTVDISKIGCACNLAFYLISSPARDMQGKPNPGTNRLGQPPYYCDANQVGGQWCPEVDIMEANNRALQSTLHNCGSPANGHYTYCDRSGCAQSTNDKHGSYGPGDRYTIDTTKPFDVLTEFPQDDGVLLGFRTTLQQGDKKVVLEHVDCDGDYLESLSDAMKDGMSLRITYWGDAAQTMAWMDSPPCGSQACSGDHAGHAVISNITVSPKHSVKYYRSQGWKEQHATRMSYGGFPDRSNRQTNGGSEPLATGRPTPQVSHQSASERMQWVPDASAPWECHQYAGDQQKTLWCATAGIQDGYEYNYNAGQGSPCGGCWCCKRKAKQTPAEFSLEDSDADLVWVVGGDQKDPLFGQVLPAEVAHDAGRFVKLHDHGVLEWKSGRHFVKRMSRRDAAQAAKKAKQGLCSDGSEAPCGMSLEEEASSWNAFLQKFASSSPVTPAAATAHWWILSVSLAFAGALCVAAISLVVKRVRSRKGSGSSTAGAGADQATQSKPEPPRTPRRASGPSIGTSAIANPGCGEGCEEASGVGTSPMRRKRSWSGSPAASLGMHRAGSSCQRLLALQENLA